MTRDWYWEEQPHKKVVLGNVEECKNSTEGELRARLIGLGCCEWEVFMIGLMCDAIRTAVERKEDTANITKMFSCDLIGIDESGERRQKQESVIAFLLEKLFDVVSETEEEMKVIFKI